ncbi:hypothetical protein [Streptomyces sp. NPDC048111]|uniref:hypothetical protein n=1 Tax=Streptomyces sp. NPDC048111 TaxID=3365500 RepID=UPI003710A17A
MDSRRRSIMVAAPVAVVGIAAAVTVTAVSANSAAGEGGSPTAHASGSHRAAPTPGQSTPVEDLQDPATWTLPIEAYMFSRPQIHRLTADRDALIRACVAKAGFPDWTPPGDVPDLDGRTETDHRYGIHDAARAARSGYHPDPALQEAHDRAMSRDAVRAAGPRQEAVTACEASARVTVPMPTQAEVVQQIARDSLAEAAKAPRVARVFAQWSACMKAKGHPYDRPADVDDDPRFHDRHGIRDVEIATAVADVECRSRIPVARTWFDADRALQTESIRKNQDLLTRIRAGVQEIVTRKAVLATAP